MSSSTFGRADKVRTRSNSLDATWRAQPSDVESPPLPPMSAITATVKGLDLENSPSSETLASYAFPRTTTSVAVPRASSDDAEQQRQRATSTRSSLRRTKSGEAATVSRNDGSAEGRQRTKSKKRVRIRIDLTNHDKRAVVKMIPPSEQRLFHHGASELSNDTRLFELSSMWKRKDEDEFEDDDEEFVFNLIRRKRSSSYANSASALAHASSSDEDRDEASSPQLEGQIQLYGASTVRETPSAIERVLSEIRRIGLRPTLASEGSGGTYFLKGDKRKGVLACFKPRDEEAFAENNPRGLVGRTGEASLRKGIASGEAWKREIAAYLLDRHHFASVPASVQAEMRHECFDATAGAKIGSLQVFVDHDEMASDLSPTKFPVDEVWKIALLDMRLLNTDRNDANILVKYADKERTTCRLIPIDHGYALPDCLEVAWCDWVWLDWKQIREPLTNTVIKYVAECFERVDEDVAMLRRELDIREECLVTFRIMTRFLKRCVVDNRISLFDAASIASRSNLDVPSELELIVDRAIFYAQKLAPLSRVSKASRRAAHSRPRVKTGATTLSRTKSDAVSVLDHERRRVEKGGASAKPKIQDCKSKNDMTTLMRHESSDLSVANPLLAQLPPLRRTHSLMELSELQRMQAFAKLKLKGTKKSRAKLKSNLVVLANHIRRKRKKKKKRRHGSSSTRKTTRTVTTGVGDAVDEIFFRCFDSLLDNAILQRKRRGEQTSSTTPSGIDLSTTSSQANVNGSHHAKRAQSKSPPQRRSTDRRRVLKSASPHGHEDANSSNTPSSSSFTIEMYPWQTVLDCKLSIQHHFRVLSTAT